LQATFLEAVKQTAVVNTFCEESFFSCAALDNALISAAVGPFAIPVRDSFSTSDAASSF